MSGPLRVLHVTEALGGGITTAMVAMVRATDDVEHHLLARQREQHDVGIDHRESFASIHALPRSPLSAILALRRADKRLRPDIVHAHSSVAGVVARAAGLRKAAVVYSPHCFAFERSDTSALQRRLFTSIERALVPRTDLFAAVAPHELDLAADLGHQHLAYVPNRSYARTTARAGFGQPLRIAAVGRVSQQKDWRYFVRLRRYVGTHLDVPNTWTWLGGGDPAQEAALRDAGVEVTGWIPHQEVLERLADQQVYVHTAAWEASPISILEAAGIGLPMAVRSIPALDSLGVPGRRHGVQAMAERIAELTVARRWTDAQVASLQLARNHGIARQHDHLWEAYSAALGGPHPAVIAGRLGAPGARAVSRAS